MESHRSAGSDFGRWVRWAAGIAAVAGLLAVFLFQRINIAAWILGGGAPLRDFLVNRSIRFIANDVFAVLLVLALFGKTRYVLAAVFVQVLSLLLILLPYFVLKINFPSYNGPLLSFLHRLTLNPLLIYILIFFFWYQRLQEQKAPSEGGCDPG